MQERKISKFFLECWQWQKTCKEFTPTLNELTVNVRYVVYAGRSTFLVERSVVAQKNKGGDKKYGSEDCDTFTEVERKH